MQKGREIIAYFVNHRSKMELVFHLEWHIMQLLNSCQAMLVWSIYANNQPNKSIANGDQVVVDLLITTRALKWCLSAIHFLQSLILQEQKQILVKHRQFKKPWHHITSVWSPTARFIFPAGHVSKAALIHQALFIKTTCFYESFFPSHFYSEILCSRFWSILM